MARVRITRAAARRSRHPELAGRSLEQIIGPRGGIRGYRTVGGERRTYSPRVVERIFRRSYGGERGSSRLGGRQPFRMGEAQFDQAVADYLMRHPEVSRGEARRVIYEAKTYLGRPLWTQDMGRRTQALIDLGIIGPDEVSRGRYPIDVGEPRAEEQLDLLEAG